MSPLTRLTRPFAVSGAMILALVSSWAQAGSVADAQAAMNQAYNNYYKALQKASGAPSTGTHVKALADQIIVPSEASLGQAINHESADAFKQSGIQVIQTGSTSSPSGVPVQAFGDTGLGSATGVAPPPIRSSPVQEDVVLDGSDIPREVEFPGAQKPVTSPQAGKKMTLRPQEFGPHP